MEGYRVMPMADAAAQGDVFVTVTGNTSIIRAEHLEVMHDGAVLCNAGHFDVEIDLAALEKLATSRREVRPNAEEFRMADGRRLVLLAQGRLVNLGAAEGHPAAVMDMSFADQALVMAWLSTQGPPRAAGVVDVPPGIDAEVARLKLASMGTAIDVLTEDQETYLGSYDVGT